MSCRFVTLRTVNEIYNAIQLPGASKRQQVRNFKNGLFACFFPRKARLATLLYILLLK